MDVEQIEQLAFGHGFAFGKYTQQAQLDDKMIALLDTNQDAMRAYIKGYKEGLDMGFADTLRYQCFDDISGGTIPSDE